MKQRQGILTAILAIALSGTAVLTAFAADRTISSVSIRIDSELESGTSLPEIDYTNNGDTGDVADGSICVTVNSDKYSITDVEWVTSTSKTMDVGDTPEMRVTLTPNSVGDDDYEFKGTYRSSNVSVRYGSFVSATKKDGNLQVKLKVRAIEGTFAAPEDAYWRDNSKGTARWEEPEEGGTGRYEVVHRRGSTKVHTVETTSRSYNFYPYMTKKGTYTFRVRTIAKTNKQEDYGKSSEWVESDEIYLAEEDVSDGRGQDSSSTSGGPSGSGPSGNTRVGWQKFDNYWYYYYPDGSYQREGWVLVADKWYLFQADGRMLTGWQDRNGQTYYLTNNGDMVVGWVQWGNRWYYMNPTKDAFEGAMLRERWADVNGISYYFGSDGAMAEGWVQVDGNWYYFYPGSGQKAVNTWVDTFYVNESGIWVR